MTENIDSLTNNNVAYQWEGGHVGGRDSSTLD